MTVFIPEYRQRLATLPRTVDFIYHYFEKVTAYLWNIASSKEEACKKETALPSLFLRLTLDVSSNWVRTKHEMSRQKDPFDVMPVDSLQMF